MGFGKFITLEGGEGVGKSTNIEFVSRYLKENGKSVITTREPGGTELGEKIRKILLDLKTGTISNETELLLIFAARAQHLQQIILPSVRSGNWVLCDRFTDASYAYQGGGRGINEVKIKGLENWVQNGYSPDLTLLLDVPVDVGLERAGKRGALDRFEVEKRDFFDRVRQSYLSLSRRHPHRIKVINANRPLADVQADIADCLNEILRP